MAALMRSLIGLAAAAFPSIGIADPVDRWAVPIAEASARFGIPEAWIRHVMQAESGGRLLLNGRPVVSIAGAMGLMQLMPATWRDVRTSLGLGPDPFDPHDNILAGTLYLRMLYNRFGYPGLFAAYNAGPARYASHLLTGLPLPSETRAYVATLTGTRQPARASTARPVLTLFAIKSETGGTAIFARQSAPPARSLFVGVADH